MCSAIVKYVLWSYVVVLHLRSNMRMSAHDLTEEGRKKLADCNRWMLDIGEGNIEAIAKEDETEASWIKIPNELLLKPSGDKIACVVDVVYPELTRRYMDIDYLRERVILTLTNDIADVINNYIVSSVPEHEKQYLSCDSILKGQHAHDSYDLLYPVEFLNSLKGNNFPRHKLALKRGAPIVLL
jgi:ATP-dependent DNA helicase PIF1